MEPSKNAFLGTKWFISPNGLKIWKLEPTKFHITCKHKGAENAGNHMEPSKNAILFQNDLFHLEGLKSENGNQLGSM